MHRNQIYSLILLFVSFIFSPVYAEQPWQGKNISTSAGNNLYQTLSSILKEHEILPNGIVGISAMNLKTGEKFSINGDTPFFMASTYKVAIATQLLTRVDQKKINLNSNETITPHDIVPGSGILIQYFSNTTITMPIESLLTLMLQESDNTATDRMLSLAGGPKVVTERLRQLGITNMSVDRFTLEFTRDYFNVTLPPPQERTLQTLMALYAKGHPDAKKFLNDKRDNTTPNAMVQLLGALYEDKALSQSSKDLLFGIMSKANGDTGRLYYYLPDAIIAQKLGTGAGVANDVGLIKLPDDQGVIAIAIYLKNVDSDRAVADKMPALIAKTIYDFFLFNKNRHQ